MSRKVKLVADKLIEDVKEEAFDLIAIPVSVYHILSSRQRVPHTFQPFCCYGRNRSQIMTGGHCREVCQGQRGSATLPYWPSYCNSSRQQTGL